MHSLHFFKPEAGELYFHRLKKTPRQLNIYNSVHTYDYISNIFALHEEFINACNIELQIY